MLGAFTRSLSVFYSVRDCERLVQETIDRIIAGVSPDLPALHCGFNLDDVSEVLEGAKVNGLYKFAPGKAAKLKRDLEDAVDDEDTLALETILAKLAKLREDIATTPEF